MKIGFIGFGSMAQAIAEGLVNSKVICGEEIYASGRDYEKLEKNCARYGVNPCRSNEELAETSEMIVIGVKPEQVKEVLGLIREQLKGKSIVSIAAGYTFDTYQEILGEDAHYICTIPNTPVSVQEGITICETRHSLNEEEYQTFYTLFSAIGLVQPVETALVGVAGTLAGCSPAFASMFIEALGDAGVKYGLGRDTAYSLAAQMMRGTGKLYIETKTHPGAMKDTVCSPGGTTIRGVTSLEKSGFRNAIISAIDEIEG